MQLLSDSFPRWRCIRKYEYRPPLREIRPKTTMHMAMLRCVLRGPSNAKMFRRRNRDAQPALGAWDDLGLGTFELGTRTLGRLGRLVKE